MSWVRCETPMQKGDLVLEQFRIEECIGEGAAGRVYRALDERSGEVVAVKVLRPLDGEPAARQRFEREARSLATLTDDAVVRYVAHGVLSSGEPVLAMEWIDGETLASRLARGPLGLAETLRVGRRLSRALGAVHEATIVHRDLKPANVLLPGGAVSAAKLADFGLARVAADPTVTRTGVVLGTPRYLAPEQARGARHVDGRADLFSLGCVLYECLAGFPAFGADDAMAVIVQILFEPLPSLATARPDLPAPLVGVVDALMRRDADERPVDARAVEHALAELEDPSALPARPTISPPAIDRVLLRRASATLPVPATPLLGREREQHEILEALQRGPVALWGPSGMGKTRLALELARSAKDAGHAAFLVDAAPVIDEKSLLAATARALGLGALEGAAGWNVVAEVLRAYGEPWLVWDGIDGVLEVAATAAESLRDAAPAVRVLLTSRRKPPTRSSVELGGLAEEPALALLLRAGADDAHRALAREIADALDRIPLALELAAGRIELVGLEGVHARRTSPLSLLAGGRGDALRAAVEWSLGNLDEAALRACGLLSVFADAFDVSAAEAVLANGVDAPLAMLERLRNESILVRADLGDHARFRVPAVIREHVRARVAADDVLRARAARRAHYAARGRVLAGELDRTGRADALAKLNVDADEMLAAFEEASHAGEASIALELVLALEPVLSARGATPMWIRLNEGARALTGAPRRLFDEARIAHARALGTAGRAAEGIAELQALTLDEEALAARVVLELSVLQHITQALDVARTGYREAAERLALVGEERAEARAEANLGAVAHDLGEHDAARAHYEAALSLLQSVGDQRLRGITLSNLALLHQESGARSEARARFEGAVEHLEAFGDVRLLGVTLGNLGMLLFEEDGPAAAATHLTRAQAILAPTGDVRSLALSLARLGAHAAASSELGDAEARFVRAERLATRLDAPLRETVHLMRAFADVARAEAAWVRGATKEAIAHLGRARLRLARAEGWGGETAWNRRADDLRTALRILRPRVEALSMFVPNVSPQ